jgi:superoxide dismutase, Cu-Zn family
VRLAPALAAALLLAAPAMAQAPAAPASAPAPKRPDGLPLVFKSGEGQARGTGTLTAGPRGVIVRLELTGLTPGWHAVHFHQTADCTDPGLQKSGGHVQHGDKRPHGILNPGGPDAGDLPNVWADGKGEVHAEVASTRVAADKADKERANLMDADGSALIVHANADDGISQPIGGAGGRVACALITQP